MIDEHASVRDVMQFQVTRVDEVSRAMVVIIRLEEQSNISTFKKSERTDE